MFCSLCLSQHLIFFRYGLPTKTKTRIHFQIRVVKAFQAGLDRREPSLTGQSAARLREISRQLRLQVDSENRCEFGFFIETEYFRKNCGNSEKL